MSGRRFPGYDVLSQMDNWDDRTRSVVEERLRPPEGLAFFTEEEAATCRALLDRLLGLGSRDRGLGVLEALDGRLAAGIVDGFRYETMPADAEAWRASLRALDELARQAHRCPFHVLDEGRQHDLLERVKGCQLLGAMPVVRLWALWLRYACAALYSRPAAWSEIGFGGPAYPRGYKNLGLDRREPWETADSHPSLLGESR